MCSIRFCSLAHALCPQFCSYKRPAENPHRWANIVCSFASLQDIHARMQWTGEGHADASLGCSCCSVATTIALLLNSKYFYLPPLRRFPKANTAMLLPVIFGGPDPRIISHWLQHNTRVLGADLMIVYSQNASGTFDRAGALRPFYSLNSGRGVVIVNVPQIGTLETHYHNQHFVTNNALLRSMGAIQYFGSFDADEFLEVPPGHNITSYLRKALQCQASPDDASLCSQHKFAAVSIGSFTIGSPSSGFNHDAQARFCASGSIDDYSHLPLQAECYGDQPHQVCVLRVPQTCAFCVCPKHRCVPCLLLLRLLIARARIPRNSRVVRPRSCAPIGTGAANTS